MTRPNQKFETPEMLDRLRDVLHLDPATGILTWRRRTPDMFHHTVLKSAEVKSANFNGRFYGTEAGTMTEKGYKRFTFEGRVWRCNRVAFALHYGHWPKHTVDHINTVKADNRPINLRDATNEQNSDHRHAMRTIRQAAFAHHHQENKQATLEAAA